MPFYRLLNVYKIENFRHPIRGVAIRNICFAIGFYALIIGFLIGALNEVSYCYAHNFNLRVIASTFGIFIVTVQLGITFASMILKIQLVNMVIDSLQRIGNKSTLRRNSYFGSFRD